MRRISNHNVFSLVCLLTIPLFLLSACGTNIQTESNPSFTLLPQDTAITSYRSSSGGTVQTTATSTAKTTSITDDERGEHTVSESHSTISTSTATTKTTASPTTTTQADPYAHRVLLYPDFGDKCKTVGRVTASDSGGFGLLHTATSVEFRADCRGTVSITLKSFDLNEAKEWGLYFTVFVDGVRSDKRLWMSKKGDTKLVLATDLPAGEHTFRLVRQTEVNTGAAYVYKLTMDGTLLSKPKELPLYIEFVGDSITAGFGNLTDSASTVPGAWGGVPLYEDGTQSFAFLTAEALGADASILAMQGIGVGKGNQAKPFTDIYKTFPYTVATTYSWVPERTADIVVVNLGTNDCVQFDSTYTERAMLDSATTLCQQIRARHPKAKIIWATGMMRPQIDDTFKTFMEEEMGGADNGYYYVQLPKNTSGRDGHPSVAGHTKAAHVLTNFIKTIL